MDRIAKKHLTAIPVEQYEGYDTYARVYAEKDVLMLHLWDAETFKGKYFIDQKGKHVSEIDGERYVRKLVNQMSSSGRYTSGLWPLNLHISPEDEQTAEAFFGRSGDIAETIERAESYYDKIQYGIKYDRKVERINNYMALFEDQEKKITAWYLKEFASEEYAFKKDGMYHCTACGKTHTGAYKHLQRFQCSGKTVIAITRTTLKDRKDWITAFSKQPDGSCAERLYQIEIRWDEDDKTVRIVETIRWTWMPYKPGKAYYHERGGWWWDRNAQNHRWMPSYLYPEKAEEVLKNSGYESTKLWDAGKAKLPFNWIMAKRTPVYTSLVLAGLDRLAQQDANKLGCYSYSGNLNFTGQTPEEVLGLDHDAIGRLKQLNGGVVIHEWLQWKTNHPKETLKTETLKELEQVRITPSRLKGMLDLMSPRKCLNLIKRQMKLMGHCKASPIIELYKDYISMAGRMGMDIHDEIVFNPRDLKQRHDQLIKEFELKKAEYEAEEMNRKWPKAQAVLDRIKGIYDYQGEGWQIITPRTLMDIVDDAYQLHHCAGASERYYERIQMEETYILFLRHDPEKAWYTLEVEPGGTVRQKRSEYNRQPDLDIVNGYLKEWQTQIRKRLKEKDKQLAAQSAQQRAEEMRELQKGTERNRQLYDLLMADLMEAGA